jgi:N-acetylneuraminic acid mutarotase
MSMRFLLSIFLITISGYAYSGWIQRSDFGAEGRHRGTGMGIGNKGYFGLGHYNGAGPNIIKKDWWEYDPATNAWTQKANYPGGFGVGSYGCLSFGMDKFGYVGGGQNTNGNEFYKYDPQTNTWTPAAPMPTTAMNTTGFVIYNVGYYLSGNNVYAYDATSNTWSTKNPAPFNVTTWNSSFVIDNKGYMKLSNSLWEYKPAIDQWTQRANFPGSATGGSMSFAQNNKGYVVTGYASWLSEVNSEVWQFDPTDAISWTLLEEFPGNNRRFGSSFEIGNRAYVGIGTNGTNFNDLWEFDALLGLQTNEAVELTIGPNPSSDFMDIRTDIPENFTVELYDLMGRLVQSNISSEGTCRIHKNENAYGQLNAVIKFSNGSISQKRILFI